MPAPDGAGRLLPDASRERGRSIRRPGGDVADLRGGPPVARVAARAARAARASNERHRDTARLHPYAHRGVAHTGPTDGRSTVTSTPRVITPPSSFVLALR
ncbi:MAG TPA: hypothetical protein QGH09_10795 [Vicinamibacterales bacterium]|nr:hypothetical protein [Vicinamibacterales bacterium]